MRLCYVSQCCIIVLEEVANMANVYNVNIIKTLKDIIYFQNNTKSNM